MSIPSIDFVPFKKIPRLSREIIITEKIDGTNATIYVDEMGEVFTGSRNRWITTDDDNYGFAAWVSLHAEELSGLGYGYHRGEWWGCGIQRGYGLKEKRFSLFNVGRWENEVRPACCGLVPVLYRGPFCTATIRGTLEALRVNGSQAAPGFMRPEGIIIYHTAARLMFKKTIDKDDQPKGKEG